MRRAEYFLFACGAFCLVIFLFRSVVPYFRSRLNRAAETTAKNLREDFLSLSSEQARSIFLASGVMAGFASAVATRDVFWMIAVALSPVLLSGIAVRQIRKRRRNRIVHQLPAFLEILSGHVKAGHSIPESFQEAIPFLPSGIREEVSWLCQSIRLGISLSDVLLMWEERMACPEVSLIVRPLRIAIPAGGNLYDLLTRCRNVLDMKVRQQEKVRSMTAQARLQAIILTLLPLGFIAVLSKIEPEYLTRCRETVAGKVLLVIAGTLQISGWLSIRKIMGATR